MVPTIPEPFYDWENLDDEAKARRFPYGEATVEFIHGDENWYPENCPELAAYLRDKSEVTP
jgi:hypothetical protein